MCGIDSVDDKSKSDGSPFNSQYVRLLQLLRCDDKVIHYSCVFVRSTPLPRDWKAKNPPYSYYMFYMFSNITTLNQVCAYMYS